MFRLKDIALLTGISDFKSLNYKINYAVRTGKLLNPRKGIYAKPAYNPLEMACSIFTPSYISLEYVLQKAGIVFQYDSAITVVSYISRMTEVDGKQFRYRKLKGTMLTNTEGISCLDDTVYIASPERAFLDLLYLDKHACFDNLSPLDRNKVFMILPQFQSKTLTRRVNHFFNK